MIVEDWPEMYDYTVVYGYHCSCYDCDDTQWDATTYDKQELLAVANGWLQSYDSERKMAELVLSQYR